MAGFTSSIEFPTTAGAYDTTHNGNYDVFISKLTGDLSSDGSSYTLTVTRAGNGTGTINVTGCTLNWSGNTGTCTADTGTTITLTAVASSGSTFTGWSNGTGSANGCSGTGTCSFQLTQNSTLRANFTTITAVRLITPNGGEVIPSGSSYLINWEAPPYAIKYALRYSLNNGLTWFTIANNVRGNSYNWSVPRFTTNLTKCLIMVIAYNSNNIKVGEDSSDRPFTIEVLRVNSPNGGESLISGNRYLITWTTNKTIRNVSTVILSYSLDGGLTWKPIYTYTNGDPEKHNWLIPRVSSRSTRCKIRVIVKNPAGITVGSDESDSFFTISP